MKKIILAPLLILILTKLSFAQYKDAYISFNNEVHDFGEINENEGPYTFRFLFSNTGGTPLIIHDIKTSCGCTTPVYSQEPILPGDDGYIDIMFDAKNRPGIFSKEIQVYSNANISLHKLLIKGNVIKGETPLEEIYSFDLGNMRAMTNHIGFSKIDFNETQTRELGILNTLNEPVKVTFDNIPQHLKIEIKPQTIDIGKTGVVYISFDASKKNDWGYVIDRLTLTVNGTKINKNYLSVSADITEDFSNLSPEQLAKAPKISFKNTRYSFDTIPQQTVAEHKYEFVNNGKSDLLIRKVKASCGCTATLVNNDIIKPGGSSYILATFNAGNRQGYQHKTITVISNDPENSMTVLKLEGVVISGKQE